MASEQKMAFATCVQLGKSCVEEIYRIGGHLDQLITLHDEKSRDKSGRIYMDDFAGEHHVPLLKIDNINDQIVVDTLKEKEIDWLFIIGWSQIAHKAVLDTPKKGCIGMHPTLLPVGRGRAPIPWPIIKGLNKTGVTMFKLDEGVDTGDIIGQIEIPLTDKTIATELYDKVDQIQVQMISTFWDDIINDKVRLRKQDESKASVWPGRKPEDGEIRESMTMQEADRLIRGVTYPYPGAFYINGNEKIVIWSAVFDKNNGEVPLADGYLIPEKFEKEKTEERCNLE